MSMIRTVVAGGGVTVTGTIDTLFNHEKLLGSLHSAAFGFNRSAVKVHNADTVPSPTALVPLYWIVQLSATRPVWLATTQALASDVTVKDFAFVPAVVFMAGLPWRAWSKVTLAAKLGGEGALSRKTPWVAF